MSDQKSAKDIEDIFKGDVSDLLKDLNQFVSKNIDPVRKSELRKKLISELKRLKIKYDGLYKEQVPIKTRTTKYVYTRTPVSKLTVPEKLIVMLNSKLTKENTNALMTLLLDERSNYPRTKNRAKSRLVNRIIGGEKIVLSEALTEKYPELGVAIEKSKLPGTKNKIRNAVMIGGKGLAGLVAAPVALAGGAALAGTGAALGVVGGVVGGTAYGAKKGFEAASTKRKQYTNEKQRLNNIRKKSSINDIKEALNTNIPKGNRNARLNALNAYINQMDPNNLGVNEEKFVNVFQKHLKNATSKSREEKTLHKLYNKVLNNEEFLKKLGITDNVNKLKSERNKRRAKKTRLTNTLKAAATAVSEKGSILTKRLTGEQNNIKKNIDSAKTIAELTNIENKINKNGNRKNKNVLKQSISNKINGIINDVIKRGEKQKLKNDIEKTISFLKSKNQANRLSGIINKSELNEPTKENLKKLINNAITRLSNAGNSQPEPAVGPEQPGSPATGQTNGASSSTNVTVSATNAAEAVKTAVREALK